MAFGTSKGPIFFGPPDLIVVSAASTIARVEGPPEPMMMPERSLMTSVELKSCIADRLIHRNPVPTDARVHEALWLSRDHRFPLDFGLAVHLTLETKFGIFIGTGDAGLRLAQGSKYLLGVVSDRGNDSHAGNDDAPHRKSFPSALIWRVA